MTGTDHPTTKSNDSDVHPQVVVRRRGTDFEVECSDAEGDPVDAVFDILQRAGGFYAGPTGQRHWVDSWRLLS